MTIFDKLVDINVEFEKLLSNEVFDELVVIHQLLVINLCPALQFHLFWVILPLYLDSYQGKAYQLQHFVRITLEFQTHVEGSSLKLLIDDNLLVSVGAKRVLWVGVFGWRFVSSGIQPLGLILRRSLVLHEVVDLGTPLSSRCLHLSELVVLTPLEPLVNLVEPLQMH